MNDRAPLVRMDMHLHTNRSFDSLNPPHEILRAARERGIDHLVITDHNEIAGALELREIDPERILVAEEVKTREGFDIIGILLHELIPRNTPARETCERIRAQGGVVYLPHPFDAGRAGTGDAMLDPIADLVDVVEVHNARCIFQRANERASEWATARGKLRGAGSDAHTLAEIGAALVELPPFEQTRAGLLAALARGRIVRARRSSPLYRLASNYAKLRHRFRNF